jgi:DNA-binding response OmpR family regulator
MLANVFLIIDGHPIFSQALVTLLGDAFPGSKFLTAGSLDQGRRQLLSCNPPPVVLLDVNLPDSKGAHGARELIRIMPGVKIIALSAEDAPDRKARLLKSSVHGFLSKTLQPDLFIAQLNELIRAPNANAAHRQPADRCRRVRILVRAPKSRNNRAGARPVEQGNCAEPWNRRRNRQDPCQRNHPPAQRAKPCRSDSPFHNAGSHH